MRPRSPRRRAGLAVGLLILLAARGAAAQIVFAPKPSPPWTAPGGTFSVRVPPGWEPKVTAGKPDVVEIRMVDRPGTAFLHIERMTVAEGGRARQLMARSVEERLRKLPHFEELSRRDVEVGGVKAATVLGHYWFQGNAQYPRAVEELAIILGRDAFVLHFECFEPLAPTLSGEVNGFYASFVARPGNDTRPGPSREEQDDPWDHIPF